MFKRNRPKEKERPRLDEGHTIELERWEKISSDYVDEEYGWHETGGNLLEETEVLGTFRDLKDGLDQFERIREELRKQIESTLKLLPELNEEKERLEKEVHRKQEKITKITNLIPNLERKKVDMHEEIIRKQEEKERIEKYIHQKQEKIEEITNLIPNLNRNKEKIQKNMEREKEKISRIKEEIDLISYAQYYKTRLIKL